MKALKIYIAGKYTPDTDDKHEASRGAHQNTQKAIMAGLELIRRGHYPYIPHLTHFIHLEQDGSIPKEYWYQLDFQFLPHCDAFLYLSKSNGADKELEKAKELGLTIFESVWDIPFAEKSP